MSTRQVCHARPLRHALGALTLVLLAAACQLPLPVPGSTPVGCEGAHERLALTGTVHLDPECVYAGIDLTGSGSTLDCQGATIRSAPGAAGVGILVSAPVGSDLVDVTVRHCRVEGFTNSLRVTRPGFRTLPEGGEYLDDLRDIVVEDNTFTLTRGAGVFVDGYVEGVTLRNNLVRHTGSSGIYLEAGSRGSLVEDNTVLENGFLANGPGGQATSFAGIDLWFWGVGREGLSVDGSYDNTIRRNIFAANANGGILLYKNCGEYRNAANHFVRRHAAADNLIEDNVFAAERNGVWIGSRMAENTLPLECSDPAYIDEPLRRVTLDEADHNTVRNNRFVDVTYGIRVEDDHNQILDNHFAAATPDHHAVLVGTPLRNEVLGRPVTGTVLRGNAADIADNPDPYRWVDGADDTLDERNTANGQPATICPGVQPWRSPFLFVVVLAVAGPGGTAPDPAPDTTVPTLGVLPPCGTT